MIKEPEGRGGGGKRDGWNPIFARWHGLGTRGKIREGGKKKKKKGMEILDVSPSILSVSGKRRGFLSLIKLNRNLISMGNVSTNRLGKDLCEWGNTIARCSMMHDLWVG